MWVDVVQSNIDFQSDFVNQGDLLNIDQLLHKLDKQLPDVG